MKTVTTSFLVIAATLALAACQTSGGTGTTSAQASPAPATSPGAKAIYDGMMADTAKMKQACQGGRNGVTAYATTVAGQLMKGGNSSIKPEADGPVAGRMAGERCANILRG